MELDFEAVVIGSGFGGSINTCRLAKKWPGGVLLLERGKRYPKGSFPRKPHEFARNFWNVQHEQRDRPESMCGEETHGMFDVRNFEHIDAVVAAGLGGGSLIYANVFLEPPAEVFETGWPAAINKETLQPYYRVCREVLGARPIPQNDDPRRQVVRRDLFARAAEADQRESKLLDICVFFGNDHENPTPIGEQERNRYGALQTSCTYCAECDAGCNTHSKNTLDLNYLFVAEHRYQAKIETEALAEKIIPLNADGEEDSTADGSFGYCIHYFDLKSGREAKSIRTRRVIVSAGTLGTNELLLRCRDHYRSLPNINHNLGKRFSANGDFLSFVVEAEQDCDSNYGPVITQGTDYHLLKDFKRDRAFILEDAGYPAFLAWYIEGVKPRIFQVLGALRAAAAMTRRLAEGLSTGRVGYAFTELLKGDLSYRSTLLLCMGIDKGNGTIHLNENARIGIDWPYKDSMSLYDAILATGERFRQHVGAKAFLPLITWFWPARHNITVHPLGGCQLADDEQHGVTSAAPETMGQVFGYQGLYVADASLLPTALGANPVATISALSEKVAEGITGIRPDADL